MGGETPRPADKVAKRLGRRQLALVGRNPRPRGPTPDPRRRSREGVGGASAAVSYGRGKRCSQGCRRNEAENERESDGGPDHG